jgi:hypothetical protein
MVIELRRTCEGAEYHYAIRKKLGEQKMHIDKQEDYAVEG